MNLPMVLDHPAFPFINRTKAMRACHNLEVSERLVEA